MYYIQNDPVVKQQLSTASFISWLVAERESNMITNNYEEWLPYDLTEEEKEMRLEEEYYEDEWFGGEFLACIR